MKSIVPVMLIALAITGCGPGAKTTGAVNEYRLTGVVMRVDAQQRVAVIKHEKIEGWMEAMTMEFPVKDQNDLVKLKPGLRIKAKVYQRPSDYEFWIAGVEAVPEGKP